MVQRLSLLMETCPASLKVKLMEGVALLLGDTGKMGSAGNTTADTSAGTLIPPEQAPRKKRTVTM
jgi:hypothetical protein